MGSQRVRHDSGANTFKARGGSSKDQRTVPSTTPALPLSNTRPFEQAQSLPPPSDTDSTLRHPYSAAHALILTLKSVFTDVML